MNKHESRPFSEQEMSGTYKRFYKRSMMPAARLGFMALVGGLLLGVLVHITGRAEPQEVQRFTVQAHDKTNFPLIGKHRTTPCRECHLNLVFEGTPRACEACHWERRQDDRYQLRLGAHCGECHTPYTWKNVPSNKWDHTLITGFRLQGIHRTFDCADCHGEEGFRKFGVECIECHDDDYEEAEEPDHKAAGFPTQCQICHVNQNAWEGAIFSHDKFALKGQHRFADCSACHTGGQFTGLSSACVSCHLEDYENVKDPDHLGLGFPLDCEICHGTGARRWEGADFSHTSFRLRGQHKTAPCSACHGSGQFTGLPSDCAACHLDDYNRTRDPDHTAASFPLDCQICHGTRARSWEDADFDHSAFTLKGEHKNALCSQCHIDGQYAGTSSECVSCHLQDYKNTSDPDHEAASFPTDCIVCHGDSARSWEGADFDHSAFTLKGEHKNALCSQCHIGGQYAGTSSECVSCHLQDYKDTTDPDHEAADFPTDCIVCHGDAARSWEGADFDHSAFTLKGEHKNALCSQCHIGGQYAGTSSECVSCHLQDYKDTTDPDHEAADFPTDCIVCHGDAARTWEDADFNHSSFPLRGQHLASQCSDCHASGQYAGLSTACITCHQQDYDSAQDPNHKALSFPTECQVCHGTGYVTWEGAVFDHNSIWPLQGAHSGLDCAACHASGFNLPRNCYGCHTQDYNDARNPNHLTAGFPTDCELCHFPTHLYWTQAVFDHPFPISTGRHSGRECSDCHLTDNFKEFSCIDCHHHEKSKMDNDHQGVTGYVYSSPACYACHPQGRA